MNDIFFNINGSIVSAIFWAFVPLFAFVTVVAYIIKFIRK